MFSLAGVSVTVREEQYFSELLGADLSAYQELLMRIRSILWTIITFLCIAALIRIVYILKKYRFIQVSMAIVACTCFAVTFYAVSHNTGSTFMFQLTTGLVGLCGIYIIQEKAFSITGYGLLYTVIMAVRTRGAAGAFPVAYLLAVLFFSVGSITWLEKGRLKGHVLTIWLSGCLAFCFYKGFDLFGRKAIYSWYYYTFSQIPEYISFYMKIGVFVLAGVIFTLLAGLLYKLMKNLLRRYLEKIGYLSEKYGEIEKFFIWMTLILILGIGIKEYLFDQIGDANTHITILLAVFMLALQGIYLSMLLRTVGLKENLEWKEQENQSLVLYNSDLEKNLQNIRAIKHDVKNMLLTMGAFVEKSDDVQMKQFYQENIYPLAANELKANDLYVQLQEIPDEAFRAFLYYKLVQAMNGKTIVRLDIQTDRPFRQMKQTLDLVRILGIFIDNGIEECACMEEGELIVGISQAGRITQYTVKNTVRDTVKAKGIRAGTTTKGLGRGNGLMIAGDIMKKYHNIIWNMYFKDGYFIQVLEVEEKEHINIEETGRILKNFDKKRT